MNKSFKEYAENGNYAQGCHMNEVFYGYYPSLLYIKASMEVAYVILGKKVVCILKSTVEIFSFFFSYNINNMYCM